MLRNVRDLLSSTVVAKCLFTAVQAEHLVWLLVTVSYEHDSRDQIYTSSDSLAALFGLDYVYYADDEALLGLNTNFQSTYVRLHDILVIDQLIINNLSTYTIIREDGIDYEERITALLECQAILRLTALSLVMQLA